MDPTTALGLATNVAQLVDLSWKIISKSHELCRNGVLPEHRDVETVTSDLRRINDAVLGHLQEVGARDSLSEDDEALHHLCESSNRIATELIERLAQVKPGNEKLRWKSFRQALKSIWIKSELDETAKRLQFYRLQLNTRILIAVRDRVDQVHQSNERIATNVQESRAFISTSQEIQTEVLSRLITGQNDQIIELLNGLLQGLPPYTSLQTEGATESEEFQPAMFEAVQEKSLEKARQILRNDPTAVFAANKLGQTPLHLAAQSDNRELAEYLIRNGARINPDDDNGDLPIHYAVRSGDLTVVLALLSHGADVHAKDHEGHTARDLCDRESLLEWMIKYGPNLQAKNDNGATALHHFAEKCDYAAVRTLLSLGADIEETDRLQRTPIFLAAEEGHLEIIKLLLSHGANVRTTDHRNDTALLRTGWHGHTQACKVLLDAGADIEAANIHGFTALDECCLHGRVETGRLLLAHGAAVDRWNNQGDTPLSLASKCGNVQLVEALLQRGCDVNFTNRITTWNALAEAIHYARLDVAKVLVQHGAAIEKPTGDDKKTALIRAGACGRHNIAAYLIDHGFSKIEAKDIAGKTALACAVEEGKRYTVSILLARKTNPNTQDKQRCTPLHRACQNGELEIAGMLVEAGASIHITDTRGCTPLYEASIRGNVHITKLLLEHGAEPDTPTKEGLTPLYIAARNGHSDVVRLMLQNCSTQVGTAIRDGSTALSAAVAMGQLRTLQLLLRHGAKANVHDSQGDTPLICAARQNRRKAVTMLVDMGKADIDAVNREGWSALHEAASRGHVETIKVLLARCARKDLVTNRGERPITIAKARLQKAVLPLLS